MLKVKKHIAVILLGIFVFPIAFQSFHVVWHHAHGYHGKQHFCHDVKSGSRSESNAEKVSKTVKMCLICDYHFSINDVPKYPVFSSLIPGNNCIYKELSIDQQYKQIFTDKSPRAPPKVL